MLRKTCCCAARRRHCPCPTRRPSTGQTGTQAASNGSRPGASASLPPRAPRVPALVLRLRVRKAPSMLWGTTSDNSSAHRCVGKTTTEREIKKSRRQGDCVSGDECDDGDSVSNRRRSTTTTTTTTTTTSPPPPSPTTTALAPTTHSNNGFPKHLPSVVTYPTPRVPCPSRPPRRARCARRVPPRRRRPWTGRLPRRRTASPAGGTAFKICSSRDGVTGPA